MDTSRLSGLTSTEVVVLQKQYGGNVLITERKQSAFSTFLAEFKSPLILILIAAAVIALATGATVSGILIISIVIISSVLDFVISYKSQKAAEALASRVSPKACVVRDGRQQSIDHQDIVPGDIVILVAGSIIPADGILSTSSDLYVNESALTGESLPLSQNEHDILHPTCVEMHKLFP